MPVLLEGFEFIVGGPGFDSSGAVAGLSNGGFIISYANFPAYRYFMREFDGLAAPTFGPAGPDMAINGGVTSQHGGIAQTSDGRLVATYSLSGPHFTDTIDVGVTWFPQDLSAFTPPVRTGFPEDFGFQPGYQSDPRLASSLLGGYMVVWDDSETRFGRPGQNVIGRVFDSTNTPALTIVLSEPRFSAGEQIDPDVAGLVNGGYVVSWEDQSGLDGSGSGIRARMFSSQGVPLSGEIPVNLQTDLGQTSPAIAALAGGQFVIVWESGGDVKARVFDPAGFPITGDIEVANFTTGTQAAPDITALKDGGFLVSWTTDAGLEGEGDGSGTAIKARAFSGNGVPAGPEVLVNSVTNGHQIGSVTATLADGRVIIAWTDQSLAAEQGPDVRAQLLDPRSTGVSVVGTEGADKYMGSAFADVLFGFGGADWLSGAAGDDFLDGGLGVDIMQGGSGNDTYVVDSAADVVTEQSGEGVDLVRASASFVLPVHVENLILTGTLTFNGTGNELANAIRGNGASNKLSGGANSDRLFGLGGNDRLDGGAGADILVGGRGRDLLIGGSGRDLFDFNALNESGRTISTRDQILDFRRGQDDIDLRTIDAKTTASGNNAFTFIGASTFTKVAGQLRISDLGSNVLVQGDVNGDGRSDLEVLVRNVGTLSRTDFLL